MKTKLFLILGCVYLDAQIVRAMFHPIKGGLPTLIFVLICVSILGWFISKSFWSEFKKTKIFKSVSEFIQKDRKVCYVIFSSCIFLLLLESTLNAILLGIATPKAFVLYTIETLCIYTIIVYRSDFLKRIKQIPDAE